MCEMQADLFMISSREAVSVKDSYITAKDKNLSILVEQPPWLIFSIFLPFLSLTPVDDNI
jgi:hypothetical protein